MKNPKRESISSVGSTDDKKRRRRRRKLQADICSQVEFYFSDANLRKDRFLGQEIRKSVDGCVPLEMVGSFNKIRTLTEDRKLIVKALHKSKLVEVTPCGTRLKRKKPLEEPKYDPDDCTVYVECLPKTADIDWIQKTFRYCGNVVYVSLPRYQSTRDIKGFAFVEYETPEEAARACQLLNNPLDDYGPPGLFPKTRKGRYVNIAQSDGSERAKADRDGEEGKRHHRHSEHEHRGSRHHHRHDEDREHVHHEDKKHVRHERKDSGGHGDRDKEGNVHKNIDTHEKHDGEKGTRREKRKRKKSDVGESVEVSDAGSKSGRKKRKKEDDSVESSKTGRSERKVEEGQESEKVEDGKDGKGIKGDSHGKGGDKGAAESSELVEGKKKPSKEENHSEQGNSKEVPEEEARENKDPLDMASQKVETSVHEDCENVAGGEVPDGKKGGKKEDNAGDNKDGTQLKEDTEVGKSQERVEEKEPGSFAKPDDENQAEHIPVGNEKSGDDKSEVGDGTDIEKRGKDVRKRKRKGDGSTVSGGNGDNTGAGKEPPDPHGGKKRKHKEGDMIEESRGEESSPSGKEGKGRRKRKITTDGNVAEEGNLPDSEKGTSKPRKKVKHMKQNPGDIKDADVDRNGKKDVKSALKEIRNAEKDGDDVAQKKKRTRQQRKEKEEPQLFLRVLSKAEWLKLKEQYLHLQKIGLQEMKAAMRAQWRGIVNRGNKKNGEVKEEEPSKPVKVGNQDAPKTSNIEFVEGVVVSIKAKDPVSSRKTLREHLEAVAPVAYVDLQDGDADGFVRFKTRRGAETVVSHKFESLSGISFKLIRGEEEKAYWDKLRTDQENKLNSSGNKRKKKRGRQRIMDRALKSSGPTSHTRFDEGA